MSRIALRYLLWFLWVGEWTSVCVCVCACAKHSASQSHGNALVKTNLNKNGLQWTCYKSTTSLSLSSPFLWLWGKRGGFRLRLVWNSNRWIYYVEPKIIVRWQRLVAALSAARRSQTNYTFVNEMEKLCRPIKGFQFVAVLRCQYDKHWNRN